MLKDSPDSLDSERQVREACVELTRRLRAGEPCRAEDFLRTYPTLAAQDDCALELIYTEFVVREELGQHPSATDMYARFPKWRDRLRRLIQVGQPWDEGLSEDPLPGQATQPVNGASLYAETGRLSPWRDEFEQLEKIGRGGMGVVYRARQRGLNRIVALKKIRAGDAATSEELERFRREAEAMARLHHPNIVQVFGVGERDGQPFIAMEYVDGGNLAQAIDGQPVNARQAACWVETLARALHYAHEQGILHRDLKPGNVLLTADGEPKITDLGLSRFLDGDASHTHFGVVIGTPSYVSPEQAAGRTKEIGPPSDVYSLGAILYELLTGVAPFKGPTNEETLRQVREEEPRAPRARNPAADAELEAVCLKCLEKRPADRYPSAEVLADDLGRWLCGKGTRVRPRGRVTRLRRWLRPHPRVTATVLAAGLLAVVVPVVVYLKDPDRVLDPIQRELVAGRKVMLLGATGPPRHWKASTERETLNVSRSENEPFAVESFDLGLVELLPDPHTRRFRLSAEVRHEKAGRTQGEVGIYFAHGTLPTDSAKPCHYFCSLAVNDKSLLESSVQMNRQKINFAYAAQRYTARQPAALHDRFPLWHSGHPPADHAWRRIAVEVSPTRVRFWWNGEQIGEHELPRPTEHARRQAQMAQNFPWTVPEYSARGALGLYVYLGKASFRNVVIEPLGEDE